MAKGGSGREAAGCDRALERQHPLKKEKDVEPAPTPAPNPVWDGILENGGLLYMPRGW
jgi:hypothetical protein